jgi:hypothetical protein
MEQEGGQGRAKGECIYSSGASVYVEQWEVYIYRVGLSIVN